MYHFFVKPEQIVGKKVYITGKDVNHIKNVLRMKVGEELALSNGVDSNEYRVQIAEMLEEEILCDLLFVKEDGVELPAKVYLYQGLPKSDKMELILQKAVELGVHEVIPVATKRAVVKLDAKKEANLWLLLYYALSYAILFRLTRFSITERNCNRSVKEGNQWPHEKGCYNGSYASVACSKVRTKQETNNDTKQICSDTAILELHLGLML